MRRASPIPWLLILAFGLMLGCDKRKDREDESWRYNADPAPYVITVPGTWRNQNTIVLDNGADFAAHLDDKIVMVIPAKIPDALGPRLPPLEQFADAGLEQMAQTVPDFEIVTRETSEIDGADAVLVEAKGKIKGLDSRYLVAYTQKGSWRYQIVGWSHVSSLEVLKQDYLFMLSKLEIKPHREREESESSSNDAGHTSQSE